MKKWISLISVMVLVLLVSGCNNITTKKVEKKQYKIGVMLSDVGLGDQSFSDSAFGGLWKARNELDIVFDYRELKDTGNYEKGLRELVAQKNDLIIGLGFMVQSDLEKVAKEFPKQQFMIVDSVSELPNVVSVTFKEDEGSYLVGTLAALKTKTKVVGFIGGMDVPVIQKFKKGFEAGVKAVDPTIKIVSAFAGDFGDAKKGAAMAKEMFAQKVDFIYPAAGFTGVGVLQQAAVERKYGFGVDVDQFFVAEKSVVSSMLKNVDVAIYSMVKELVEKGKIANKENVFGIKQNGVGLAPVRIISLEANEQAKLDEVKQQLVDGSITIQ